MANGYPQLRVETYQQLAHKKANADGGDRDLKRFAIEVFRTA